MNDIFTNNIKVPQKNCFDSTVDYEWYLIIYTNDVKFYGGKTKKSLKLQYKLSYLICMQKMMPFAFPPGMCNSSN